MKWIICTLLVACFAMPTLVAADETLPQDGKWKVTLRQWLASLKAPDFAIDDM